MLKQLRERTKTILWIVVVAFVVSIFAVWGMNLRTPGSRTEDREVAGTVDGELIYRQVYERNFTELFNQFKLQRGEDYVMTETERLMLANQAWEMTIQKILLRKEIERQEIIITDTELVAFLRSNPHPSLRQAFQTEEGQFDYQAYLEALSNPEVDWTDLELWGRSILPEMKLQMLLEAQVHVSNREILERFHKDNIQVKATYVEVPLVESDSPYEPTEEEISALYEESKEEYKEFEKRRIRLIEIEAKPTAEDEAEVLNRMLEIKQEILGGLDFAEAARSNSDDYMTAQNGGDLGFFERGEMVPEFEEAAFSLETGEISEPVRTQYGFHLIKVEEKKSENETESIHARHILMKVDIGYETSDSLATIIQNLREEIAQKGFEKAAGALGLTIKDPPPFQRGSFIQDLGFLPRIVNFAFNHKPGSISNSIGTETSIYFVKVVEEIPETYKPLDEVRPLLVDRIRLTKREEAAKAVAESIRQDAMLGGELDAAAHKHELEIKETPLFKETDTVPGIGVNTAFAKACHLLAEGQLSPPVKGSSGYYIIRVTERTEPDMNAFAEQRNDIEQQLKRELTSSYVAGWYDAIRKKAKVTDLRETTLN
jgi:parvulin-like peptidyl-prolyl isomerase